MRENVISSSPEQCSGMGLATTREAVLLVSDKDLESRDYLSQRDRAVALPFLHRLNIVNVHHKVLLLTLVMNFRLRSVSTRHFAGKSRRVRVTVLEEMLNSQYSMMIWFVKVAEG